MKVRIWKILAAAMWLILSPNVNADVLVLKNGDRLTGELVEKTDDLIRFRNPVLGVVEVRADSAEVEQAQAPTPTVAKSDAASTAKRDMPVGENAPTISDKVRQMIGSVVPGNISGRLDIDLNRVRADSTTTQANATSNLTVTDLPDTYTWKMFYYYSATENSSGVNSRSADRYGTNLTYRHDLSERWFISNEAGYLRDFAANINHQAQDMLGLGYAIWKTDSVNLTLEAGPTERYTDAEGLDDRWFTLGSSKQNFTWQISEAWRFEQEFAAYMDPSQTRNYAWKFHAGFIHKMTKSLELTLRFSQSYNTIIGLKGARNEQMISFGLGLPF